ncbi:Glycosyltransferase family 1 protein [Mycena venus]|uniref:Glycosyltransferase family 1 protein n=1 Tax=Mycena venus TaxID=2733690 RepID=A0A8H6Y5W3_9AGAR|nr:Glycosyltransferase family 1 protein [Mycena venus]
MEDIERQALHRRLFAFAPPPTASPVPLRPWGAVRELGLHTWPLLLTQRAGGKCTCCERVFSAQVEWVHEGDEFHAAPQLWTFGGLRGEVVVAEGRSVKDWLAQAELSVFTNTLRNLFYTLGEDYHALILVQRYQFAIGGAKIDVWHEVEVSTFAFGLGVMRVRVGRCSSKGTAPRCV